MIAARSPLCSPPPPAMAAKEDLYGKVTPRRNRQLRAATVKHGSSLDILLSMGFPKARAIKITIEKKTWLYYMRQAVT
uniref:Ubiquitin-associated and SH3 domain-containing protein B n=1 Tax=Sphaerodactylus townsendi TaxID=933632 RepID=A0ACB8EYH2_9SAUR